MKPEICIIKTFGTYGMNSCFSLALSSFSWKISALDMCFIQYSNVLTRDISRLVMMSAYQLIVLFFLVYPKITATEFIYLKENVSFL